MLENSDLHILDESAWLRLSQEKMVAREQLLQLSPQTAQLALNSVIDPALLQPDFSQGFEFNSWSLVDDLVED
jgi:hypothetical protein